MLLNSIPYLFFFTLFVVLYYLIPKQCRYICLAVAGYFFYACWNVRYTGILLYITTVTYFAGLALKKKDRGLYIFTREICVFLSAILCMGVLFVFKYYDFFCGNIEKLFSYIGLTTHFPVLNMILPVGISFYIFQAFGYVIDVFRNKIEPEYNFVKYAAFVSFFPSLLSGPIERAGNLLKQIQAPPVGSIDKIRRGLLEVAWGVFLKIVLSDNIAPWVNPVYNNYEAYGGIEIAIATMLFGIQIYCDFAGYSLMAVGCGRILGYDLADNFKIPYFSSSPTEFWRRWHISLTSWFRDYLYIPLGGNRKGMLRKWGNIIIVFLVSGLWHGASWAYIFWGGLNGIYLIAEDVYKKCRTKAGKPESLHIPGFVKGILSFLMIDYAWLFFKADSLRQGMKMTKKMVCELSLSRLWNGNFLREFGGYRTIRLLLGGIIIVGIVDFMKYRKYDLVAWIFSQCLIVRWCIYLSLLSAIIIFGIYGYSYEQTQFIYFQF